MAMDDRDGLIWLDGAWLPWREAKVLSLIHISEPTRPL